MSNQKRLGKWIDVCAETDIQREDVIRFDFEGRIIAVFRSPEDKYYATDGICTHERAYLSDGLVINYTVECPKHSGIFDYRTGEALGAPVCINLGTHPVKIENGRVFVEL